MTITLEQIFYGRGSRGYAVLGTSPGAKPFAPRIEALCGAVGTPAADYGGEPFLLSVPDGDRVLLICGRRGAPDGMGRGTLFFHALVVEKTVLSAAKADAFSLFKQGAFADRMPTGEIKALRIDANPGSDGSPSRPTGGHFVDASLPCVIRSDKTAPNLVRAVLAGRVNDCAWSTFAFQFLDGFTAQVLPARVAAPRTANEYDPTGKLLRPAATKQSAEPRRDDSDGVSSGRDGSTRRPSGERVIDASPPPGKSPMLKFSLAANVVLAVLCSALLVLRKTAPQPPSTPSSPLVVTNVVQKVVTNNVPAELSDDDRNNLQDKAIADYRATLVAILPKETNLGSLHGFKSVASWQNDEDPDREKAFSAFVQITNLLDRINNP